MAPTASVQARPFYKRIYRAIVHAMYCFWLGIRNIYSSPFGALPVQWIPVIVYLWPRVEHLVAQSHSGSFWFAISWVLFLLYSMHMNFRGERRGRIYTLWALKELSNDERDEKIDEMWLKYGWTPLKLEKADQDLPVTEEQKRPLLVEV
ncbi:hypothetical protein IFR05_011938 [Cadophora sp. M221]|nr:hypothetical protein IFR05_011938 [Cadophora sp. M221]